MAWVVPLVVLLVLGAPGGASAACVSTPTTVTIQDPPNDAEPGAPDLTAVVVTVDATCTITFEPQIGNRPEGLVFKFIPAPWDQDYISIGLDDPSSTGPGSGDRGVRVERDGAVLKVPAAGGDSQDGPALPRVGLFGVRATFEQLGITTLPATRSVGAITGNMYVEDPENNLIGVKYSNDQNPTRETLTLAGPAQQQQPPLTAAAPPTAPTPASQPVTGTGKPALALRRRSVTVGSRGRAPVRVDCGRGSARCEGVATLTARGRLLGEAVVDLPAGATKTVSIKLSASARRLLARQRRLVAKLRVELDTPDGKSVVRSFALTLRGGG